MTVSFFGAQLPSNTSTPINDLVLAYYLTARRKEKLSVFKRYDIVDVEAVRQAFRKTDHYRETRTETDSRRVVRL